MKILIFGATGFIGKALTNYLYERNHEIAIISRNKAKAKNIFSMNIQILEWDFKNTDTLSKIISHIDVIINLAGENIASKLWTKKHKVKIINSRILLGNLITDAIAISANKPELLIQASAIGIYGYDISNVCTENSKKGTGFLAYVSEIWENSTQKVSEFGVKRIVIRTGIVLGRNGGMFPILIKPIKYFIGHNFGKGTNWISWIHLEDEIKAIEFLIENNKSAGIYNLTAPQPVMSSEINKLIGARLKRPIWFKIPSSFLKLLLGEMAKELLLSNQKVKPEKLLSEGFCFKFQTIKEAIDSIIKKETSNFEVSEKY